MRSPLNSSITSVIRATCWLVIFTAVSGMGQSIPESVKASHRTLYQDYHPGVNIMRETQAGKDVNIGAGSFPPLYGVESRPAPEPSYPDHQLHAIACDADAILVASSKSSETDLTDGGDFLYTDYLFRVETVLKNPSTSNLSVNSDIIVTRPGGETKINGREVKTEALGFPLFQNNVRYLLFLRYLPESKTYEAFRNGTFVLPRDGAVTPIDSSQRINTRSARREDTFVTEVRAAATAPCDTRLTPKLY
jgi:hypothetical protein